MQLIYLKGRDNARTPIPVRRILLLSFAAVADNRSNTVGSNSKWWLHDCVCYPLAETQRRPQRVEHRTSDERSQFRLALLQDHGPLAQDTSTLRKLCPSSHLSMINTLTQSVLRQLHTSRRRKREDLRIHPQPRELRLSDHPELEC